MKHATVNIETISMPTYDMMPRSVLPPLFDLVESMYPYTGYCLNYPTPKLKEYKAIVIKNDLLKVTVLPELGGRILQIEDMHSGCKYLEDNGSVRPVRIPPRWAFLSLGIELNFPTTHSPTGTEPVGYELICGDDGNAGVAVGERDIRLGLCWRAEIKLYPGFRGVCIAARCWNPTETARDVQWWSNCAQPAGGDTEFIYPEEPILAHIIGEQDGFWPEVDGRDLRWHRNYNQMCGMFWEPTKEDWFGIYHHERDWGLLHLSDPAKLPGKKLWSFGHTGRTADWTLGMTRNGGRTCEIQSGIPTLQKNFVNLAPGDNLSFVEFWIPIDSRGEMDESERPSFSSIVDGLGGIEKLNAIEKELDSPSAPFWKKLITAYESNDIAFLQQGYEEAGDIWPPTGLSLESALQWASNTAGRWWTYQLGLWYSATEQWDNAKESLEVFVNANIDFPPGKAILGLLYWKQYDRKFEAFGLIKSALIDLPDGQLLVHADNLLKELDMLPERLNLIPLWPEGDFRRTEIEAEIALDSSRPERAIQILMETKWERHHCRHRRGEIWLAARKMLGLPDEMIPDSFGEDPLMVDEGNNAG